MESFRKVELRRYRDFGFSTIGVVGVIEVIVVVVVVVVVVVGVVVGTLARNIFLH